MAELGLFPDGVILFEVEDTDVIARLLPPRLARWRSRRKQKVDRRQQHKEKKQKKREAKIAKRRIRLEKEAAKKKAERLVRGHFYIFNNGTRLICVKSAIADEFLCEYDVVYKSSTMKLDILSNMMEDGDLKWAVQLIASCETIARKCQSTVDVFAASACC